MAEHGRDLAADQLQHRVRALLRAQPGQPADQRVRGLRTRGGAAGPDADQAAQQRRHLAALPQRAQVETCGHESGGRGRHRAVEQGEALLDRQRRHAGPGHPLGVGLGEHAVACPRAPRQRDGGGTGGTAELGQGVQEVVAGGVVGLSCRSPCAGQRREQHQRHAGQRDVQVPGGVDLRRQHRVQPLRRERGDHAVVQYTGAVHDCGDLVRGDQGGDRGRVRDIARHHGNGGTQRFELRHVPCAATRHQHELAHTVRGDQMLGDDLAQTAGTAGDQDLRAPLDRSFLDVGAGQARRVDLTVPERELRFLGSDGGSESGVGGVGAVELDQRETAWRLGLRRTHHAPHRGGREVGAARHEDDALVAFFLQQAENALGQLVHGGDDVLVALQVDDDGVGAVGGRDRHGHPVDLKQRVTVHGGLRRDRPHHQRID